MLLYLRFIGYNLDNELFLMLNIEDGWITDYAWSLSFFDS